MDIIGAMNKEREYLSFRAKGEEPYHWADAVKEYGFESLSEYFEAKRNYQFSQLKFEVIETPPNKAIADIMAMMDAKKTAILFVETDKTLVWNGNQGEYDTSYCEECGIPIYPIGAGGGTIVSTPGDLNIGICFPSIFGVDASYILEGFAKIFRKYTYKLVEVSGNDVLVGGVKVLGSSVYGNKDVFMFVTSVSLSDKSDLICQICLKHSTKQPGYVDFLNKEQLRQEVLKWITAQ
jgi:hypothetical protein